MAETNFSTPLLLIAFNRLDTTRQVLAVIRQIKPRQLFFAVDAPRSGYNEEQECRQVRDLVKEVDWPCELQTFFPEENLGARLGVSSAVSWFFSQVAAGIVLEHDCLPHPSFFQFCQELLAKYRCDERVGHISGNFFQKQPVGQASYYFSRLPHIWGWASWRRAWQLYDLSMSQWPEFKRSRKLKEVFPRTWSRQKFIYIFDKVFAGRADTWDYQWTFALMANELLAITPNKNLVTNIGYGPGAVHSANPDDKFAKLTVNAMDFPLQHPLIVAADRQADNFTYKNNFSFNPVKVLLKNCGLDLHKIFKI